MKELKFSKKMQLKTSAKPTTKELDDLCRDIVMKRDGAACRRCGRKKKDGLSIHWTHFISRSNKAVRWDLDNSMALCYTDHLGFMHGEDGKIYDEMPHEFWRRMIGEARYTALRIRACNKGIDRNLVKLYLLQEEKKYKK